MRLEFSSMKQQLVSDLTAFISTFEFLIILFLLLSCWGVTKQLVWYVVASSGQPATDK